MGMGEGAGTRKGGAAATLQSSLLSPPAAARPKRTLFERALPSERFLSDSLVALGAYAL